MKSENGLKRQKKMSLMAAFELKLFQNGTQMKIAQRKLNKNEILSLEFSVFETPNCSK